MHFHPRLLLSLLSCLLGTTSLYAQALESPSELQLSPGDALRVEVKDEPDLGGQFPVSAEGYVLVPTVGRLHVVDRPFSEIKLEIFEAYSTLLTYPVVQLTPLLRIAVLGEVRQPGLHIVDPTHGIADLLALAGGLTPMADDERISLLREERGEVQRLDLDSSAPSIKLRSGDQLFVGRRSWLSDNAGLLIGAAASVATAAVTSLIIR